MHPCAMIVAMNITPGSANASTHYTHQGHRHTQPPSPPAPVPPTRGTATRSPPAPIRAPHPPGALVQLVAVVLRALLHAVDGGELLAHGSRGGPPALLAALLVAGEVLFGHDVRDLLGVAPAAQAATAGLAPGGAWDHGAWRE